METFLVVDDHPLYRDALLLAIRKSFTGVDPVGVASAEEGLELVHSLASLKLILLDMGLPGISGAEAVSRFRQLCPDVLIAVLSSSDDRREVTAAFRVGAKIFISKAVSTERLLGAIKDFLSGNLKEPLWITKENDHEQLAPLPELTSRQREILIEMMQGFPNKEIALRLHLSEVTVKMHITAIFKALNVVNRTQAVLIARRLALGTLPEN